MSCRKDRKIVLPLGIQATLERLNEISVGPFTDAGLGVRRDVGAIVNAEGCLESAPPRERSAIALLVRVTTDATTGTNKIVPPLDRRVLGIGPRRRTGREQGNCNQYGGKAQDTWDPHFPFHGPTGPHSVTIHPPSTTD